MLQSHRLLKVVRTLHLYFGVFMAPALLFFAVTGGLQSFGLHESERGSSYRPPAWLVSLSHLHKKQSIDVPVRKRRPPPPSVVTADKDAAPAAAAPTPARVAEAAARATPAPPAKNLWPMKIFFGLVALSLVASTLGGPFMAYRFKRDAKLISGVLAAGIIVPLLLLLF